MTVNNLLFVEKDLDRNTPIYRFVPWRWASDLFVDQNLTLVRPERWEDPYEMVNIPIQLRIGDRTGSWAPKIFDGSSFEVFSQCWTSISMTDTMLRAYSKLSPTDGGDDSFDIKSHADESIQISTTVGKLLDAIDQGMQGTNSFKGVYVARVKYKSDEELASHAISTYANGGPEANKNPSCVASLLFVKRMAYRAENEIRPVVLLDEAAGHQPVWKLKVDPHALIDSITIDPRVTLRKANGNPMRDYQNRASILEQWGFADKIVQSHMYSASPMYECPTIDLDSPDCTLPNETKSLWRTFLWENKVPQ
ncbi:hypothetical protein HT746_07865 [Burkholderia pyrrocinia]|uniref:hypothetical protein n=1 Tax=Burkholderia pyrrocinia TaxID=60550 RepID=UPI001575EC45|nr:hypothetical protein [Burkholderia pyrrocinia]NTX27048.1 hypothetical protein [Burkholderia pyrrocinia]